MSANQKTAGLVKKGIKSLFHREDEPRSWTRAQNTTPLWKQSEIKNKRKIMRKYKTVDTMLINCVISKSHDDICQKYCKKKNAYHTYINKSKDWFIISKVKNKYKLWLLVILFISSIMLEFFVSLHCSQFLFVASSAFPSVWLLCHH